ncbi:MAG TPA: adenylate/guanylate cyclase domain-containing protein [Acidimicrobiales bacterium]|nr:adenylate/guanylate cyclase domain-containing protein [Acidimicrobiales bacterium]
MAPAASVDERVDERRLLGIVPLLAVPNFVGAVLVFVFQNFLVLAPGEAAGQDMDRVVTTFVVYMAVAFPAAGVIALAMVTPVRRWLAEGRAPTEEERLATLTLPRRLGTLGFAFWIVALLVFGTLAAIEGGTMRQIVRDGMSTILGGLTSAVFTFLVVESWLRPVVAHALAGQAPRSPRSAGIAPRILLSWALGSGVPLLALTVGYLGLGDFVPRPRPGATLFLATLGLGVGALMLALAARSVSAPIAAVREALRRVQNGDVDVEVPVDDGGQIGQLQAGVNQMVEGLRERRRLEDLFGRYVGAEVAADALARGAGLGGENRDVSALFVDIIASTEFAHERDPAEVVATLNEFFGAVVGVVTDEGGWVNKFEGDGALCVFGAPGDQPDHPTRALRAARLLHERLAALRDRRPALAAGIGVSTGTVVAGHVGAVERFEYTVIGDAVNEAARLTEAAKDHPTCVLASGASVRRADPEEQAHWSCVSAVTLRGRAVTTEAWAPATTRTGSPAPAS